MQFNDLLYMSVGYTLRQRQRLVPVLFGIALGAALLISIFTGVSTMLQTTSQQILGQGSLRQITVTAKSQDGANAPLLNDAHLNMFQHIEYVKAAHPQVSIALPAQAQETQFIISIENMPDRLSYPTLVQGNWPGNGQVLLPDSGLMNKLGKSLNAATLMGQQISLRVASLNGLGTVSNVSLKVVGIYHWTDSSQGAAAPTAYTSLTTVKHLVALNKGTDDKTLNSSLSYASAIVDVDDPTHVSTVAQTIEAQGFITNYIEKQVNGLSERLQELMNIALAIAFCIIAVVSLSIGNLLASSVRQRQREIGVMIAIGFSKRAIGGMIAGETISIGVLGSLCGSALALLGLLAFSLMQPTITLSFLWWSIPVACSVCTFLCFLAGLWPAHKAKKMDPVLALKEE
jgi:ABC-type transport system, involved in lipoprotein release, permease component